MKSKRTHSIKVSVIIAYITLGINVITSIFFTPFLLSKVGVESYGVFAFAYSISTWLQIISSALAGGYIRFSSIAAKTSEESQRVTNFIYQIVFVSISLLSFLFSIVVILFFQFDIIPLTGYSENLKRTFIFVLTISMSNLVLSCPLYVSSYYIVYKSKFIWYRGVILFTALVEPLVSIIYLLLSPAPDIVLICVINSSITLLSFVMHFAYAYFRIGFRYKKVKLDNYFFRNLKEILVFSIYVLFTSIVTQIDNNVGKTILGFLALPQMVAIYQLALTFKVYLSSFTRAISLNFTPLINNAIANNDFESADKYFLKSSKTEMLITLFLIGGFLTSGKQFALSWVGDELGSYAIYVFYFGLVFLILAAFPETQNTAVEIQKARNMHKFRSILYLLSAIVNVLLTILLICIFKNTPPIIHCVVSACVTNFITYWVIMFIYNKRALNLSMEKYFKYFVIVTLLVLISFSIYELVSLSFAFEQYASGWLLFLVQASSYSIVFFVIIMLVSINEKACKYLLPIDIYKPFRKHQNNIGAT